MDQHGRLCFLALQKIFLRNPRLALDLIKFVGSPEKLFAADREKLKPYFFGNDSIYETFSKFSDWGPLERELKKLSQGGITAIGIEDEVYPKLLREIYAPPLMIFVRGEALSLLHGPCVAIVGARKASDNGRIVAVRIAEELSNKGICVVSGMAFGIDAAAHRGAMGGEVGTVAVMGVGIDSIYPASHTELADKILKNGLIVSEFPPGEPAYPFNFPQRNRVISGLSLGTVVIEAAEKSGSLITARIALSEGREVMACPGGAGHLPHRGTNRLIHDGAALVESGDDVAEVLKNLLPKELFFKKSGHFADYIDKDSAILNLMRNFRTLSVDEICIKTEKNAQDVLVELTRLTLAGKIEELPGRVFKLKKG